MCLIVILNHIRKLPQASYPSSSEGRQNENHSHRKLSKQITWITALCNSMKLWAMPFGATQDRRVMVESSDKMWSPGEGNGKPLQYFCLENPMNSMKRQKDLTPKDEPPNPQVSKCPKYTTGEEPRNGYRKNEEAEPKWKQCSFVDVTGDGSKVQRCKEQYCIGIWNVRSMNQGKLEVVKQDGKNEHRHSKNQWTKTDWNGWI